ncbi:Trm112 family protein [Streptomyces sp. Tu 3180]|uniref:Trm112 family protein n=1 Tax=Streptomyces sp. Tu 3180 TaxID=2682611 RepID=UPI001359D80C|nr:Trm112 family protein [Streptomyces sp. Tu 3180]KAF3465253.1 Trm112 family protein [Streptomyces sp. Tu 3180]
MNPDDPLLRILACPLDKGPLHLLAPAPGADREEKGEEGTGGRAARGEALYNPRLRRRYPIVDGIPQLLPSSGEQVTEEEHEELLTRMSPASSRGAAP